MSENAQKQDQWQWYMVALMLLILLLHPLGCKNRNFPREKLDMFFEVFS